MFQSRLFQQLNMPCCHGLVACTMKLQFFLGQNLQNENRQLINLVCHMCSCLFWQFFRLFSFLQITLSL